MKAEKPIKIMPSQVREAMKNCLANDYHSNLRTLRTLFPDVEMKETYRMGERFSYEDTEYILSFTGYDVDGNNTMALTNLETGGIYLKTHLVKNTKEISDKEMLAITDGKNFILV